MTESNHGCDQLNAGFYYPNNSFASATNNLRRKSVDRLIGRRKLHFSFDSLLSLHLDIFVDLTNRTGISFSGLNVLVLFESSLTIGISRFELFIGITLELHIEGLHDRYFPTESSAAMLNSPESKHLTAVAE